MPTFPISSQTTGALITASIYNGDLVGGLNALQAGTVALTKVTLDGDSSDPAVSASGEGVLALRTDLKQLRVSIDGGAYKGLGGVFGDPLVHLRSSLVTLGEG